MKKVISSFALNFILSSAIFILPFFVFAQNTPASLTLIGNTSSALEKSYTLSVYVSSSDQAINAVSGTIIFPQESIKNISIVKNESILSFWIQEPKIMNNIISFEGLIFSPGFQGENGKLFDIQFFPSKDTNAIFRFTSGLVLANDGIGTNVLSQLMQKEIIFGKGSNNIEITKPFPIVLDKAFQERVKGRILLQVEGKGEAWYISPKNLTRYYLKDGAAAYESLRKFGLGITNANLAKIPIGIESRFSELDTDNDGLPDKMEESLKTNINKVDTDGDGVSDGKEVLTNKTNPLGGGKLVFDTKLVQQLSGYILLQVESRGEAWYVNPSDGKRYYMKDGEAAYNIMRFLSLGITNKDLSQLGIDSQSPIPPDPIVLNDVSPVPSNLSSPIVSSENYVIKRFLTEGSEGEDVRRLQLLLQKLGYFPKTITPNGLFGPTTVDAVADFQRDHNLVAVGYVGPETRKILNSLFQE